jgi:hypothetical protein
MSEYRINDPQKGIIGPVRLPTVRDLMAAGVIQTDVLVSKDSGPFLPIGQFPEIPTQNDPSPAKPTYAGDIGKNTFFKLFYRLHLAQTTGLLVVQDDKRRKDIYLVEGQPALVLSNVVYESLGEFLALRARLDRAALEGPLAADLDDDFRLAETLVAQGLLRLDDLATVVRAQQAFRLVDLCLWPVGRYGFFEGKRHPAARDDLFLAVPDLIVQAAREMSERALFGRLANHFYKTVRPTARLAQDVAQMRFAEIEKTVLKTLTAAPISVAALISRHGAEAASRKAALMMCYLLWEIDAVSFDAS